MLETTVKKNKISLIDYNYKRDIENRLLLSDFSVVEVSVLEEILFSPIKTPIRKMGKNLDIGEETLIPILEKFSTTGLLHIEDDSVVVDKEMRKYFEAEIEKFNEDFIPGMEFLQNLLKKVPIHVLPLWYSIPRTSNNIFASLVEKYLLTPQIFQRYLLELNFSDPAIVAIAQDVFRAPDFKIPTKKLVQKYGISKEQLEEYILLLEFHFVCCSGYQKNDNAWEAVVTPFQEWRDYLTFLKTTTPSPLSDPSKVVRFRPHDFSFVEDMTSVIQAIRLQEPISDPQYLKQIQDKIELLNLKDPEIAKEFLEMRLENKALYLYRHPQNKISSAPVPEKVMREAEKSIGRVLHCGWVLYDDFFKGVMAPLGEFPVMLKKCGKCWKYAIPEYTPEEKTALHATIFEWLFEAGITAIGTYEGQDCFMVTPFGQSLFG